MGDNKNKGPIGMPGRGGGRPSAPDNKNQNKPGPISFIPRGPGTAPRTPNRSSGRGNPITASRPTTSNNIFSYNYNPSFYTPAPTTTRNNQQTGPGIKTPAITTPPPGNSAQVNNTGTDTNVDTNTTIGAAPNPVKLPSRDVVNLIEPGIDATTITNLLYENVGATELTKFTRHDTVDGINPYYNIISNLSDIKRKYDPSSLISLQKTESSYFDIYSIKLDQRLPDQTYLDQNNLTDYIYVDTNGDLVIELVNLASDEIIEVEIDTSGTIYEVNEL